MNTFSTGSALSTALVFVKGDEAGNGLYDVILLVDHDHSCRAQTTLSLNQRIKVHQYVLTDAETRITVTLTYRYCSATTVMKEEVADMIFTKAEDSQSNCVTDIFSPKFA